jgi:hypothetical protein
LTSAPSFSSHRGRLALRVTGIIPPKLQPRFSALPLSLSRSPSLPPRLLTRSAPLRVLLVLANADQAPRVGTWKLYRGKRRASPRRSVDCLEKNPVVQTLRPSPPSGRLPRRNRAPLGRPDVLDALHKQPRLEHGEAVHHNLGDCLIFGIECGIFREKSGMAFVT